MSLTHGDIHASNSNTPAVTPPSPALAERTAFEQASQRNWQELFFDPGTANWENKWFLDGEIAAVRNTAEGLRLTAGPRLGNDAHHMVLWTREVFAGDLKIEFDFTRRDFAVPGVNILYIQATGSGSDEYGEDIAAWKHLRQVPAMRTYFNHMHVLHISYATAGENPDEDYIRARRYIPECATGNEGIEHTDLAPDYLNTGLFAPGVTHAFTVIKHENSLVMRIEKGNRQSFYHWDCRSVPPVTSGRIGLRLMAGCSSGYANVRISKPTV